MPMEMVIPASDMMLAWMSMTCRVRSSHSSRNEHSTDKGRVTQMTKALRTCQGMRNTATTAMIISSAIARVSVWMAEEMIIAVVAVFLILWHVRSAFVICVTLP